MEESYIRICNCSDTIYYSTVSAERYFEHRLPRHVVMFVRSGKLLVEDCDGEHEITTGQCVFLKRDCRASITKMPADGMPFHSIAITLSREFLKDYAKQVDVSPFEKKHLMPLRKVTTLLPKTTPLEGLYQSLVPYADREEHPSDEFLRLKMQEAVMCLMDIDRNFIPTLFDFSETWKIDILDFMEQNYTEDMTLEEFASYTGRSLASFKRDFAKVSSQTPQKWLLEHRLSKAYQLITERGMRTADVYIEVGFKNRSHFSSAFKKQYGFGPSECGVAKCGTDARQVIKNTDNDENKFPLLPSHGDDGSADNELQQ